MNDILGPALFVPLMFAVVGTVFLVGGIRSTVEFAAFRRRAVHCGGVVTDLRRVWQASHSSRSSSGQYIYYPVLAFRTVDGRDVQTVARVGTNPPAHRPGDQVAVQYDPRDPSRAYAGKALTARVLPVVFALVGGAFAVGGITMVVRSGVVELLLGAF